MQERGLIRDDPSPIYDALKRVHELAISIRDTEYTSQFLEDGRNNMVDALHVQDSPEAQEVVDSFLDREFRKRGLMKADTGRHTDTSRLGRLEQQEYADLQRIDYVLKVGDWLEYSRSQEQEQERAA